MNPRLERASFWAPRVLGILIAAFISLFALDVFEEGLDFWQTCLALLMHLMPTWLILGALAVAWRWEAPGGLLFAGLGALYILSFWGRFPAGTYAVIAGPLFLICVLFEIHALAFKDRLRLS